ncbi:isopeptide-forming domain-containing fimbrial protein [Mollicutes bacterium LVI A0039]|nr:isopeptide-forming domain-containing fimbrial protein [Mollicutes bacterium LVI A0039]
MKISLKNILFSFMTLMVIGQTITPTIIAAAELNSEMFETIATIEDFEENEQGYTLTLDAKEEVGVKFEYDVQNDINNFDFNLNDKLLSLDQSNVLTKGENTINIERKSTEDKLTTFDVQVQNKNIDSLEVISEEQDSEVILSETTLEESSDTTTSETSSEEQQKKNKSTKAVENVIYHPELVDENTEIGMTEFAKNSKILGDVVISGDVNEYVNWVALMDEVKSPSYGAITPYYKIDGAQPFELSMRVSTYAQTPYTQAGDSFSILFSGAEDPDAIGDLGVWYGLEGLPDSFAVLWDFFDNTEVNCTVKVETATTNAEGNIDEEGCQLTDKKRYKINKSSNGGALTYKISIASNGEGNLHVKVDGPISNRYVPQEVEEFDYDFTDYLSRDFFPKLVGTSKGYPSRIVVGDFYANGTFIELADLVHGSGIDDEETVEWGSEQTMAYYVSNTTNGPQEVSLTPATLENYTEKKDSVVTNLSTDTTDTNQKDVYLMDGEAVELPRETSLKAATTLQVPDPRTDVALQTELLADNTIQKATVSNQVNYSVFEEYVADLNDEHVITGEPATFSGSTRYEVPTLNLSNTAAVQEYLLEETEFAINDPYLPDMTQEQILNSPRTTMTTKYNSTTKTAVVDVSYMAINNETITRQIEFLSEELQMSKKVDDTGKDMDSNDTVKPVNNNLAEAGEELLYTVTVKNLGSTPIRNAVVTENMDGNLDQTSINSVTVKNKGGTTLEAGVDYNVEGTAFTFAEIPGLETYTITYRVNTNLTGRPRFIKESINNTTVITSDSVVESEKSASVDIEINKSAAGMSELTLSKSFVAGSDSVDHNDLATANETLTYQVVLDNTGSAMKQKNVVITDTPDADDLTGEITNVKVMDGETEIPSSEYTVDKNVITITNIPAGSTYTVTYDMKTVDKFTEESPITNEVSVVGDDVEATLNASVDVKKDTSTTPGVDATISATDKQVNLSMAPKSNEDIIELISPQAYDIDGTNISDDIKVTNIGAYNLSKPTAGEFELTLGVTGSSGKFVTTTTNLTVVADSEEVSSIEMLVASPVYVKNGNKLTDAQVVDQLLAPYVLESISGTLGQAYSISSSSLVSNGGYDNKTNGTYIFKLVATGKDTGLEVEQLALVTVTDDMTDLGLVATIDGADVKVLEGSYYGKDVASVLHKDNYDVVTAEVNKSGAVTPVALTTENVIATNVDTSSTGKYTTTYYFKSDDAEPISTLRNLTVEVVSANHLENAVISATDVEVKLSKVPGDERTLIDLLQAEAFDSDGTDISSEIDVIDIGEYDLAAPKVGTYQITLGVVGSDGVTVTTTANIKVAADGESRNKVEMIASSPVFVEKGSELTDAEVVDQLVLPHVLETIAGKAREPQLITSSSLVSNGGYDNNTNGVYTFKLAAKGEESNLEVEKLINVVVTDDVNKIEAIATIDGADIKVLEGSYYSTDIASLLHKESYDTVTAVVNESGKVTPVALTADNIIASNVSTVTSGTYTTTYYFASKDFAAPVSVVSNVGVEVVASDISTNARITASSNTVRMTSAPTTEDSLISTISGIAVEADGTDITSEIQVLDFGGYDLSSPELGTYKIRIGVVGSDGVTVTTDADLTIVPKDDNTKHVNWYHSSRVFVENGNDLTPEEIVDQYVNPYMLETVYGVKNEMVELSSENLKSAGGYNADVGNREYVFVLEGRSEDLDMGGSFASIISVYDSIEEAPEVVTIDASDIKVLEGSYYSPDVASVLHADNYDAVTAEIHRKATDTGPATVTPDTLTGNDIIKTDVNTETPGTYKTAYYYELPAPEGSNFETSVVRELKVEVVSATVQKNAVISATDAEVELSDAPTSVDDLLTTFNATAFEVFGKDITSKIEVVDFGGYDLSTPALGSYPITLGVKGNDGVTITTTANLKVLTDGSATNKVEMLSASPVFVKNGSGLTDAEVVDQLILPYVSETIDGVANEPYEITSSSLVTNGGYDNNTNGTYTFKLVATGKETGLEVEQSALVVVASDITDLEAVATIDGAEVKVLEGSYYGKDVASVLHADNYDVVTAEVNESGTVTPVGLTADNILATNVNTSATGTYTTTYRFASSDFAAPVSTVRNLAVEVVAADFSKNAVVNASDAEVEVSKAPTTASDLLTTLNAKAFEAKGTDITSKIEVVDFGGYDLSAPAKGNYTITLGVVGSDDVMVTTTANLKVVADGAATNKAEMLVSSPVFVKNGNGLTDAEVVDQLILPYMLETIDGTSNEPYVITSSSLVSNGGYDNSTDGTYTFKLVATGVETGLEVEQSALVTVTNDITDVEAVATIDGADIKVLEGSYYGKDVASVLHKDNYDVVTAEVTESGTVTPVGLTEDNILATNVNTSATGTYTTTYRFASSDFAAPVSVVRNFNVEVVAADFSKNAVISASDAEVELSDAPTTVANLVTTLNATAFEADETDITSKIEVVDFGGYDLSAPAEGNYTITLGVVGSDDVMVTTTANLKVVADGAATNKVEMLVSSPVFVENGNGLTDAEVVEGLIVPYVLETMDGVANEPYAITSSSLVSNGGYANNTNGTYTFKLVATGVETGLEVEQTALVVVAEDITDLEAVATIDGADIKVLEGSYYAKDVASVLHKDNYDVVTAEVNESGTVTPVGLTAGNIIATNVNTSATGTYTTTYRFASSDFAAPVSVVRNLAVEVVAADFSENAVISASDAEVELSDAPKAANDLVTTLNATASEADGTDITSKIEVVDFGGYDLSAPAEGNYTIILGVVGSDDVMVTTTANLKVVADGAATNKVEMLVSSPVFVENGNGLTDAEVVEGLILPYVLETIDGVANEPYAITSSSLVSNGGYDNKTNGTYTFKLVATGVETGLEVEQTALVVVAGDITDLEAVATIDGADIKVLEGSYYGKDVASVLHKDNYDVVTVEVNESGTVTPVGLTADNIISTNVNTSATGTYTTTYRFASKDFAAPVSVVRNFNVEVVAADFSENAVISASDAEVELSDAPKTVANLVTTLNATAFEADETDITSKIEVVDFGGYDLSAPAEGNYTITLGVVGNDDVMVTTTANLKVVADGAATNKVEMLVSSPVFVENGNGLTDAEVVEGLILPYVLETIDGVANEPYAITSSSLVSNGGYDNKTNGTYTFKLVATGVETGLEVEQTALVVVAGDITDLEAVATIDGADIKVLEGSYYGKDVASVLHKDNYDVVTAEVNESGTVTPVGLTADNILATNVNTSATGTYTTTYRFASSDFAAPVSVVRNLAVEVVATDISANAVISASDAEVELSDAPKTVANLVTTLNATAFEADETDITSKIEVVDFGGYDLSAPAEGNYTIILGVVGSDDVMVTTTANLKVVADGAATNKVEMLVSSPVFVENGNGLTDAEVVDQLILPYVLETIDGVANEPYAITSSSLVSNGGYANNTNGTYTFKLVATGVETGLEVEQTALVVVADDITDLEAVATIDGADIKVLEGSYYGKDVASVLHKDNYDVVTAEVNESGTVTPVGLTADNILATNVNTSATGTYTTTYRFASSDFATPVSTIRNFAVEVVATDISANAVISASDAEVELSDAPTTVANLVTTLNATAFEADETDITSKIEVVDFGGYDLSAPAEGNYTITLGVVGSDDVMVTTTANLKVVADGAATNKVEMLVSSPVFVENGNGLTDAEVVEGLILPYVLETIDGTSNEPYAITSSSLVSNGGYDNNTNGTYTFKLVATGKETGLEVEQTALVVVADDITDLEAVATIDGADIKVLEGSYYGKDVASVLHKDNYDVVTAEVNESGTVTPVGLTADNILATNVNTSATGTYTTTYRFASSDFAAPVSTMRNLAVEVVASDFSENAVISASDAEVELSDAPTTVANLVTTLNATAFEADETDITSKIEVVDFGGYDLAAPAEGNYTIILGVVGSDDVMVTTTANLKVVADGAATNAIEMLVSSPVFVENGNGLTDAEVVEGLILPYVLETIDGVANEPYAITSTSLVSNGGYDNKTNGTYTFKLVATGVETGLEVEQTALVVVAGDITDLEAVATIDGADIKVLEGSYYGKDVASVLHKDNYDVVTAEVNESGTVTPVGLTADNILATNVNTSATGTYTTTYRFASSDFAAPVSTVRNLAVEVVAADISTNAVINASDAEVELSDAPTTVANLVTTLNATAFEADETDITSKIEVVDFGGYDLSAPAEGNYTITLGVVGSDDVMVTTTANLKVVADGAAINAIEMLVSSPVFVENGNGLTDAEVVDQLILPYVLETIDGVANEPYAITSSSLVSNGGYDNKTNGTYTFKLVATGKETGLEVEQAALVVVAGDITDLDAVATIDGADIKVLEGSYYGKDVASVLHKDNYDVVTAEVNESGTITPVGLTADNILATNVDTSATGTYTTTYRFASSDFAAPVSVVRNLAVEVVATDISANAVISASDAEVELSDAPTTVANLVTTLNATAFEADETDITSKIEVVDFGGYDLSAPAEGNYTITLGVVGSDDVMVTTTANLKVVADGAATNAIEMLVSSPVFVENGNGLTDAEVVEGLILPYVLETIDGVANEPYAITSSSLVSNGGYANNTNGTYTFKLVATGKETGLKVEQTALVVVADDITDLETVARIDGADIKVSKDSNYSLENASKLHADNYDVVTAEIYRDKVLTDKIALDSSYILSSDVDVNKVGTYSTVYYFTEPTSSRKSSSEKPLSVIKRFEVEVVEAEDLLSDLEITKDVSDEDNDQQAEVNELISYGISVSNNSTNTVFNDVVISDDFSSEYLDVNDLENIKVLDQDKNDITDETLSIEGQSLIVRIAYLMPGDQITINFEQKLSEDLVDGDVIDNIATVEFGSVAKQSNNASITISNPQLVESEVVESEVVESEVVGPGITLTGSNIIAYIIALISALIALVVAKRKFQ